MMKNFLLPLCLLLMLATGIACSRDSQTPPTPTATAVPQSQPLAQQPPTPPSQPRAVSNQATAPSAQAFRSITPKQAMDLIKTRKDLLVVDVRNPEELRNGAIADATLVPFWNVMRGQLNAPKQRPILLICAVGGRSYAAGQVLARQGYREIYNLSGGIDAWKKQGFPLQ